MTFVILSFKSKALRRLWEENDARGMRPDLVGKARRILAALDEAEALQDLNARGVGFHRLKGDRMGWYSFVLSRNWRITFRWHKYPTDVDLEDYH